MRVFQPTVFIHQQKFLTSPADGVASVFHMLAQDVSHIFENPIVIVGILALALVCLFSIYYAGTFLKALYGLRAFFSQVATGNLNEELDSAVLKRGDELSELFFICLRRM